MISRISGKLTGRGDGWVEIETGGLCYEIQVPQVVSKALDEAPLAENLTLLTIYYLHVEQARSTPVLLGFQNSIQKEFFEKLLTVPRMGPKGALQSFARPVSTIATAIETANYALLQSLPGVGKQKARDLVATLQGKVAMFALMQDADLDKKRSLAPVTDIADEALQLLQLLGHKRPEAERLVNEALAAQPTVEDAEALVRVIYKLKQEKK